MKFVINKKKNYMSFGLIYFYLINCIIGWVLYTVRNVKDYNIVLASWWINIIFFVSFYSFFRIIGKIGLQHIIVVVCFFFNFGQTFMWTLGIIVTIKFLIIWIYIEELFILDGVFWLC